MHLLVEEVVLGIVRELAAGVDILVAAATGAGPVSLQPRERAREVTVASAGAARPW